MYLLWECCRWPGYWTASQILSKNIFKIFKSLSCLCNSIYYA